MVCVCKLCCRFYLRRFGIKGDPSTLRGNTLLATSERRASRFPRLRAKREEKANRNGSSATLSSSAADDVQLESHVLALSKLLSFIAVPYDEELQAVDTLVREHYRRTDSQLTEEQTAITIEYLVENWDDSWAEASDTADTVAAKQETADTDDDTVAVQPPPPPQPPPPRPPPLPPPPPPPCLVHGNRVLRA